MSTNISRRQLIKRSGATLGATVAGLPLTAASDAKATLKVVVTGGHPDDPESGCGGLIALLTAAGHDVTIAYLTRGEAGIAGVAHDEAAAIRTKEAKRAADILGATPRFMGQIDGDSYVSATAYRQTFDFLNAERPDLLLTHWPIDTHRDHRGCSMLTYNAWLWMEKKPDLYFYEVVSGGQTQNFAPTNFVDISTVRSVKHQACFAHVSQNIAARYQKDHGLMEEFRGMESGHPYAEAFVRHWWNPRQLPGLAAR
ncbi:MAG: PIG-L family deacetylase [Tunicatimonas sp.]